MILETNEVLTAISWVLTSPFHDFSTILPTFPHTALTSYSTLFTYLLSSPLSMNSTQRTPKMISYQTAMTSLYLHSKNWTMALIMNELN
jgi:hypothetical protein